MTATAEVGPIVWPVAGRWWDQMDEKSDRVWCACVPLKVREVA